MIAFGCAITRPDDYARFAAPGIDRVRAREPDAVVLANSSPGSIFRAYNLILDQAADHDGLEALVLLHQDVELADAGFGAAVRAALADDRVALAGAVGAIGVRSLAWWEGSVTWASFTHRYHEYGGGELPAFAMDPERTPPPAYARTGEVDTLDGVLLVLSPWAVRTLRFDESLGRFHGYDLDLCLQARSHGRRVVTAPLKVIHHHSLELLADPESWVEANLRLIEKWSERFPALAAPPAGGDRDAAAWRTRALRAESEAAAARTLRISAEMQARARERELQAELATVTGSASWRLTAPLRRAAARWRTRRAG